MISNNFSSLTQFKTTTRFHLWNVRMCTCGCAWDGYGVFLERGREEVLIEHMDVPMFQAWGQALYSFISFKSPHSPTVEGLNTLQGGDIVRLRSHLGTWQVQDSPLICRPQSCALSTTSVSVKNEFGNILAQGMLYAFVSLLFSLLKDSSRLQRKLDEVMWYASFIDIKLIFGL